MDTIKHHIKGVSLTPLKVIPHPKGEIRHGLKSSEESFEGFGEAYFSQILTNEIKGWKKHTKMTLNLVVPVGQIRFVVFSELNNEFFETTLGKTNYQRLTIQPNLWVAFQGIGNGLNLLLNLANIEHEPKEADTRDIEEVNYQWV